MANDKLKQAVAQAVVKLIKDDTIVGVGTGSTVNFFIEELATIKNRIEAVVSSSEASTKLLQKKRIPVVDLNSAGPIDIYVDGADEITEHLQMIKGGGGALTREKVVGAAAEKFICIADETKVVDVLGRFPLPIEVIPMARSYVARQIVKLGGDPVYRKGTTTDNGNIILDIHNLRILEPSKLESELNNIPGVVTNGLFAIRPADIALIGTKDQGVVEKHRH